MSQARTNARKNVVQALYQWQMTGVSVIEIERQFREADRLKNVQRSYFSELLQGVPKQLAVIDKALDEFVDRPVAKIDPVERAILRMSIFELLNRLDIPYRVILNEAVSLSKLYGAEDGYKYINGVLDKIAHRYRSAEVTKSRS
ncbi:MAG: transcription antitermination factor NusB [Methylococcales bacterium]|jgi:N utilization substance protein B|nr:transcription antitermination factor NusB [Methylococcales bacterium]MBT3507783.1 transcription antitermination factor NusB [Methylococcales bacterium]MBT3698600.1 transcription antitermination factor NusB [Methylococcales bacterium]MBT3816084.1 transcription antitermination factor NusB [Methylococcales bacterium]MBT4032096.1 transcription antitermination factor NusB [Methylococcales bacterium]